jgi:hypothetical protein
MRRVRRSEELQRRHHGGQFVLSSLTCFISLRVHVTPRASAQEEKTRGGSGVSSSYGIEWRLQYSRGTRLLHSSVPKKNSRGMNSFRILVEFLQSRRGLSFGEILNLFAKSPCSRRRGRPAHYAGTVLRQEQKPQLSAKGPSSMRAKYLALGEGPFFNESQIFASRRRSGPHS